MPETNKVKSNPNFIQIIIFMLASIVIFLAGGLTFWFFQDKIIKKEVTQTPSPSPSPQASVAPVLPSPVQGPQEQASPSPINQVPVKTDLELLREAMAQKHSKQVSEVNLTIGKNTGTHASGGVAFSGEIGGGWWLAAKTGGSWVIVDDGNGTISCEIIAPYNFPASIVPECVKADGTLVQR